MIQKKLIKKEILYYKLTISVRIGDKIKKEIINFENEEQKIEEELDEVKLENSENNGKKVRYEDGTWKFF